MSITELSHAHLVAVRGELDTTFSRRLLDVIGRLGRGAVIVNLGGVTYLDDAGVEGIARAKQMIERRGDQLSVISARGLVRQLFELKGEYGSLAG